MSWKCWTVVSELDGQLNGLIRNSCYLHFFICKIYQLIMEKIRKNDCLLRWAPERWEGAPVMSMVNLAILEVQPAAWWLMGPSASLIVNIACMRPDNWVNHCCGDITYQLQMNWMGAIEPIWSVFGPLEGVACVKISVEIKYNLSWPGIAFISLFHFNSWRYGCTDTRLYWKNLAIGFQRWKHGTSNPKDLAAQPWD